MKALHLGLLAASAAALIMMPGASPAWAAEAPMVTPAFGNTIVSVHPDGRRAKLWLNRDGTYAAQGRKGQRSGGVWKLKGTRLCLSQRKPVSLPLRYCKAFPHVRVGATWSDIAVTGERVKNRLVAGR